MSWIWEKKNWPQFYWDEVKILKICNQIHFQLGKLTAKCGIIDSKLSEQAELDCLLQNILKSSEIEGESLNVESVRSSLAKRLKIKIPLKNTSARTEGVADLQMDVFRETSRKLNLQRLYQWHRWLFSGEENWIILIGGFRQKNPMQIVSGRLENPTIHFEAPPSKGLKKEIRSFLNWFEGSRNSIDPFVRAGISHLWFLTIHPFEDGNGRLARILSELALAQYESRTIRLYSLSSAILDHRKEYYEYLEKSQRGELDITHWLGWFLKVVQHSLFKSNQNIDLILFKKRFWDIHREKELLPEQRKILNLMIHSDTFQFRDGVSASQYKKITKVSKATATRHLTDLFKKKCLKKLPGEGRSTKYILNR
jgi:Fic family protein